MHNITQSYYSTFLEVHPILGLTHCCFRLADSTYEFQWSGLLGLIDWTYTCVSYSVACC